MNCGPLCHLYIKSSVTEDLSIGPDARVLAHLFEAELRGHSGCVRKLKRFIGFPPEAYLLKSNTKGTPSLFGESKSP